ncbi:hypothetical protein MTP06_00230 [Streptomyces sp. PLM4]|uniref:Uncharacterized protein n=1 Tax=Streptomyces albidoflavus TaxID=1886 RepID=A0AA37C448_9ACTN|nr:hypothetical protein MTP06_00230 [Streptomyces sp. PLM4]GHI50097.1 hypothetical protein ScoT_62710 [Streptomyces albidoflavus]
MALPGKEHSYRRSRATGTHNNDVVHASPKNRIEPTRPPLRSVGTSRPTDRGTGEEAMRISN